MGSVQVSDWRQKVAKKREESWKDIPIKWKLPDELKYSFQLPLENHKNDFIGNNVIRMSGVLTERELNITENYTVSELLTALAQGKVKALELTVAFSKRAAVAQQLVNLPKLLKLTRIWVESNYRCHVSRRPCSPRLVKGPSIWMS